MKYGSLGPVIGIFISIGGCRKPDVDVSPPSVGKMEHRSQANGEAATPASLSHDIEASLAREDPVGFGELALGDQRVLPTNCKQWMELRRNGYQPSTSLEVQADGGALFQCETLRLLKRARPARVSFVRELPTSGNALLGTVPAAFATAESPERAERLALLAEKGASLAAFDPKAKVEKSPVQGATRIAEGDGQSLVDIRPVAWADFNGDGVEDMAMSVRNSMTEGSHSVARVLVVTRNTPTEVLRVIEMPAE